MRVAGGVLIAIIWSAAAARAADPIDFVPEDTLLCWAGRPFPDSAAPAPQNPLATLLDLGTRLAGSASSGRVQLSARLFEAFGQVIRYPHAFAMIDARARPTEEESGRKLDALRFALIVKTSDPDVFRRIIQKVINEQTDSQRATLSTLKFEDHPYQSLRDQRLPEWCEISWGELQGHFVFTIGTDVWPQIAAVAARRSESLSRTGWVAEARKERQRDALIEIVVNGQEMRNRLDPYLQGRASAFFNAWHAEDIEQAYWALGFHGRAMYCEATFLQGGTARRRLFADESYVDPSLAAVIPDEARYAVYRVPMQQVLPRLVRSLYATRSPELQKAAAEMWERVQRERGFNAERDILAHLGDRILLHNDPPHPFQLPLAMTTLTEIRSDARTVQRTVDVLCGAWRDGLKQIAEESGEPDPLQVHRDADGIWYVQFGTEKFGIAGPAWVVTDRYIITSWSPAALRMYLSKLGDRLGKLPEPGAE